MVSTRPQLFTVILACIFLLAAADVKELGRILPEPTNPWTRGCNPLEHCRSFTPQEKILTNGGRKLLGETKIF